MANNFSTIKQQLLELEPTLNAVPTPDQERRQITFMLRKHLEQMEFWADRGAKHEAIHR